MKRLRLLLFLLLGGSLGVQAQCFFHVDFICGFHEQPVSFYLNDQLIFKEEKLNTLQRFFTDENTRMYLLFTFDTDSTCYVANLYSRTPYNVKSHLYLNRGWQTEDITLKIIRNQQTFIRRVNLSKGTYINIVYEGDKKDLIVTEAKKQYLRE